MSATASRAWGPLGILIATLVISGCAGAEQADQPGSTPITPMAVAAVAVEHLGEDTIGRSDREAPKSDPEVVWADLRYPASDGDESSDGDAVLVGVAPQPWNGAEPCDGDTCVELDTEVEGAVLQLRWLAYEPEEDPGEVVVTMFREDGETSSVAYSGPRVTADPRGLDLPFAVDDMVGVLEDERLRYHATAQTIALGQKLEKWEGGSVNRDPEDLVANTSHGIAYAFASRHGQITGIVESPMLTGFGPGAEGFGPMAIGGRAFRQDGRYVHDVLAAPVPPEWMTSDPCESTALAGNCVTSAGERGRLVFAWRPDPGGGKVTEVPTEESEVGLAWMISMRADEVVAVRMRAPGMPREQQSAMALAEWEAVSAILDDMDSNLSLWCDPGKPGCEKVPVSSKIEVFD